MTLDWLGFVETFYSRKDKLQITPLSFGDVWILHPEVSEFGVYLLKFRVFGFCTNVSEFGFCSLKFESVWILHPQILKLLSVKSNHSQTLGSKIQTPLKFKG